MFEGNGRQSRNHRARSIANEVYIEYEPYVNDNDNDNDDNDVRQARQTSDRA